MKDAGAAAAWDGQGKKGGKKGKKGEKGGKRDRKGGKGGGGGGKAAGHPPCSLRSLFVFVEPTAPCLCVHRMLNISSLACRSDTTSPPFECKFESDGCCSLAPRAYSKYASVIR